MIHYVTDTAKVIGRIDGSIKSDFKPDYVIFLDKSGRPVSWLVDLFWGNFSDIPKSNKPPFYFIKLDRLLWFEKSGCELIGDESGNIRSADGGVRQARIDDFHIDNIAIHDIAMLRSLFLTNYDKLDLDSKYYDSDIMEHKSILDNKNVLIIDEVASSGSTLMIAKKLFEKAFNNCNVEYVDFWHDNATTKVDSKGKIIKRGSTPVWYYHNKDNHNDYENYCGRRIGDIDENKLIDTYKETNRIYDGVRMKAFEFVATPIELYEEQNCLSLKIAQEMISLHDCFVRGEILFRPPIEYGTKRCKDIVLKQGFTVGRGTKNSLADKIKEIANRGYNNVDPVNYSDSQLADAYELITYNNKKGYLPVC